MYKLRNRINAFIFLEDTFIQAETHTKCVINILVSENIIRNEEEFYQNMKDETFKDYINNLTARIESQSVFGEITIYNGKLSIIVFDKLNSYGVKSIKEESKKLWGSIPLYYLNLNTPNRILVELY